MKKLIILGLAVAVMALNSFTASADSNDKYPAANFEPHVIYLDQSVVAQTPAPASNSQSTAPCLVNATAAKATAQPAVEEFDPKYPAANFQPKVIYP